MWYREFDNSISRWAPSAETLDALPPTRVKLASDAIIIAFNFGPLPIGGGRFVLIKQEE